MRECRGCGRAQAIDAQPLRQAVGGRFSRLTDSSPLTPASSCALDHYPVLHEAAAHRGRRCDGLRPPPQGTPWRARKNSSIGNRRHNTVVGSASPRPFVPSVVILSEAPRTYRTGRAMSLSREVPFLFELGPPLVLIADVEHAKKQQHSHKA